MPDQATGLRALAHHALELAHPLSAIPPDSSLATNLDRAHAAVAAPRSTARFIAITSGKGGVGKSNLCVNMAALLARSGLRVVVLDADLGLANVHVLVGIQPRHTLEDLVLGNCDLCNAIVTVDAGFQILAGASGIAEMADMDATSQARMVDGLKDLDRIADTILIDTGAGISQGVMAFLLAADEVVLVTTPEPTSLTDAYATIKVLTRQRPTVPIRLIVNMAANREEARAVAERLCLVTKHFLDVEIDVLGCVPHDPAVSRAVRSHKPFAQTNPGSPAARGLAQAVARLSSRDLRSADSNRCKTFITRLADLAGNSSLHAHVGIVGGE